MVGAGIGTGTLAAGAGRVVAVCGSAGVFVLFARGATGAGVSGADVTGVLSGAGAGTGVGTAGATGGATVVATGAGVCGVVAC